MLSVPYPHNADRDRLGYTREEKKAMKRYEKQGRENAKNYIKEKYGFDAAIKKLTCETYNSGPVPDFSPSPTGNVFVKMNYHGEDFLGCYFRREYEYGWN